MKITAYDVVWGNYADTEHFVQQCNYLIRRGWQPYGPPLTEENSRITQVFVKYEQENDEPA